MKIPNILIIGDNGSDKELIKYFLVQFMNIDTAFVSSINSKSYNFDNCNDYGIIFISYLSSKTVKAISKFINRLIIQNPHSLIIMWASSVYNNTGINSGAHLKIDSSICLHKTITSPLKEQAAQISNLIRLINSI